MHVCLPVSSLLYKNACSVVPLCRMCLFSISLVFSWSSSVTGMLQSEVFFSPVCSSGSFLGFTGLLLSAHFVWKKKKWGLGEEPVLWSSRLSLPACSTFYPMSYLVCLRRPSTWETGWSSGLRASTQNSHRCCGHLKCQIADGRELAVFFSYSLSNECEFSLMRFDCCFCPDLFFLRILFAQIRILILFFTSLESLWLTPPLTLFRCLFW